MPISSSAKRGFSKSTHNVGRYFAQSENKNIGCRASRPEQNADGYLIAGLGHMLTDEQAKDLIENEFEDETVFYFGQA